jgi:fumarylacetoacetase
MPPFDVTEGDPFGPHNLPYGVFSDLRHVSPSGSAAGVGVRIGDHVLDAGAAAHTLGSPYAALLAQPSLNPLLAAGRTAWRDVRRALTAWVTVPAHRADIEPLLHPLSR